MTDKGTVDDVVEHIDNLRRNRWQGKLGEQPTHGLLRQTRLLIFLHCLPPLHAQGIQQKRRPNKEEYTR